VQKDSLDARDLFDARGAVDTISDPRVERHCSSPGTNDGVQMAIKDSQGNVVLDVAVTTLIDGNQQAHRVTGKQF
jgi:hypothetical protein